MLKEGREEGKALLKGKKTDHREPSKKKTKNAYSFCDLLFPVGLFIIGTFSVDNLCLLRELRGLFFALQKWEIGHCVKSVKWDFAP